MSWREWFHRWFGRPGAKPSGRLEDPDLLGAQERIDALEARLAVYRRKPHGRTPR